MFSTLLTLALLAGDPAQAADAAIAPLAAQVQELRDRQDWCDRRNADLLEHVEGLIARIEQADPQAPALHARALGLLAEAKDACFG